MEKVKEKLDTKEAKELIDSHRKSITKLTEGALGDKSVVSKKIVENAPLIAKIVVFIQLAVGSSCAMGSCALVVAVVAVNAS